MDLKGKKTVRIAVISLLAVFGVSAAVVGCGRSIHKNRDPEKIRKYIVWQVNDKLDDLEATESQRKAVVAATEKIFADFMAMKDKQDDKIQKVKIISELERGVPNSEKYHQLLDQRLDSLRDFAHRTLDTALKAFMTLDTEQRKDLMEEVREHMEEHHS